MRHKNEENMICHDLWICDVMQQKNNLFISTQILSNM